MKVCTDACLFGAWAASDERIKTAKNILDIGAGTGLLSLMLAQATAITNTDNNIYTEPTHITAVEIEAATAKEAASNFALSPWSSRLSIVHNSIQTYFDHFKTSESDNYISNSIFSKFDCIISNPPFFERDLKSPDEKKNLAAHSAELPWNELVENVFDLLKEGGTYYVLIPTLRSYTMQKLCDQKGLQLVEEVLVHNSVKNLPIRAMQKYVKPFSNELSQHSAIVKQTVNSIKRSKIYIKDVENKYDAHFTTLLKEFYLQF